MDLFQNPLSIKQNRIEKSIWVAKLVLISIGIISVLVLLKVTIIPYTFDLVLSTLPQLWVSIRTWLTVPFLYIIINFIIITIAASSNFSDPKHTPIELENHTNEEIEEKKIEFEVVEEEQEEEKRVVEVKDFGVFCNNFITDPSQKKFRKIEIEEEKRVVEVEDFGVFCNNFITDPLEEKCRNDYYLTDLDCDDTMEATWKAIMEGKDDKLKPYLKKSDTWTARIVKAEPFRNNGGGDDDPVAWAERELKKSETLNDRDSLRREKSMSPEDLNKRAEDFIHKFNNQMKLQRLESYQRFMKLVNSGV